MIPRYTPPEFAELWSDQHKYQTWLDVELAACRAMEEAKLVPAGTAHAIAPVRAKLNAPRIDEIEQTTRHDVIAFLTHVEELAGAPARYLHRGMTSSDVLDTSFAMLLSKATQRIEARFQALLDVLEKRINEYRHTPMMGRSHGIQAEPITMGLALAGHYAEFARAFAHIKHAHHDIRVGKIAGAVGTYAHLDPSIEAHALAKLGLRAETVATQVVARDRHASLASSFALAAAAIERLATNVRHWQRSEVGEAYEAFGKGQKGSSAMPHKKNPILSENLCGLARVVRAAVTPALENIALWHERDISHSSVERMLFPDVTSTLAFMIERATKLVEGLVVMPEHLARNLDAAHSLWASEAVLLKLVDKGIARQEAYVWVQRNALEVLAGKGAFVDLLCADVDIAKHLSRAELASSVDVKHALRHVDLIIDRALSEKPT